MDTISAPSHLADVPLERLEAELCTWSANFAAAEYRWFALLAEFDRRLGWQQWECHSCVAWMAWQLGLDARTAREKLRVAHALAVSPLIAQQMRLGRLSYSKVRAITRITEPANEASLVDIALAGTTAHVERVVAVYRRALPPPHDASDDIQWAKRGLHVRHNDDRTITLTITLPAPTGMEVLSAIDHLTPKAGPQPHGERPSLAARRADAIVAMAGTALAATDDQLTTNRPRYLIHLHTGDDQQEAHPDGRDDEAVIGVSDETAERLCCDADQENVTHNTNDNGYNGDNEVTAVSDRSSVIRGRLRRLVQLRDRTCRVPGCDHRARREIHHLHHRGLGGTDHIDNLLLVCAYHHHRLHEGQWLTQRHSDGTIEFTLPNGRTLPATIVSPDGSSDDVHAQARQATDGRCQWQGDRLDLDWTLMTLFSNTPWHDPWRTAWNQQHSGSAEPLCARPPAAAG
ncbi:MAG: HNH endonuclease [Ilumatobacteraceae bacterium]|nr:HNH endonuclease [Ilumatobacteraceae bacterium]